VTEALLAASRDTAGTHLRLGELFVSTGATTWAENHFAEALAADPGPSDAAYLNGRIAELRGDRDSARRAYRRTLGFDPSHAGARSGLERLRKEKVSPETGKRSAHVNTHPKAHGRARDRWQ
jgi:Flp pilus assembly protein TadD